MTEDSLIEQRLQALESDVILIHAAMRELQALIRALLEANSLRAAEARKTKLAKKGVAKPA